MLLENCTHLILFHRLEREKKIASGVLLFDTCWWLSSIYLCRQGSYSVFLHPELQLCLKKQLEERHVCKRLLLFSSKFQSRLKNWKVIYAILLCLKCINFSWFFVNVAFFFTKRLRNVMNLTSFSKPDCAQSCICGEKNIIIFFYI